MYPRRPDLADKKFWACIPCDAFVGCHPGTENPLGSPANKDLRRERSAAHAAFDPIWKEKLLSRKAAYGWLAEKLQIEPKDCHIGHMNTELCRRTVSISTDYYESLTANVGYPCP